MTLINRETYQRLIASALSVSIDRSSRSAGTGGVVSEVEMEFRFKPFYPQLRHTPVVHHRIKEFMRTRVPGGEKSYITVDDTVEIYDNFRRIIHNDDLSATIQRKQRLDFYDNEPFALRGTISREDTLSTTPEGERGTKPKLVRKRQRTRIPFSGFIIDLTRVENKDGSGETDFEIELEVPNFRSTTYEEVHRMLLLLFRVYRSTNRPYTVNMYSMIANFFSATLAYSSSTQYQRPSGRGGDFDDNLLSRTRGLKMQDLVYGGIVGPKYHYSVTPKADGNRAVIIFHTTGLWLYIPSGTLNLLISTRDFTDLHGTILDAELIPHINRIGEEAKSYQYLLFVFDCLAISSNFAKGTNLVQEEDHKTRMEAAQRVVSEVSAVFDKLTDPKLVAIRTKSFIYFNNAGQFFDAMERITDRTNVGILPYKTDGYVFTPRNTRAIPFPNIHKIPIDKRVLTDYPEIVKWKDKNQLTIDFVVDTKNEQLLSWSKGKLVPFTFGSLGFTSGVGEREHVDWPKFRKLKITKDVVCECAWSTTGSSGFYPYRLRHDKYKPNNIEVANVNFKEILRGITLETLLGKNTDLLRTYHNRVKASLLDTAVSHISSPTILDLGTGRGGDVHKWKSSGVRRVYAVEPNPDNYTELQQRMREFGSSLDYQLINCGAEETETIRRTIGEEVKVDIITSMLSATFFWKDDQMLQKVVNTIKQFSRVGSLFLIFTLNGQLMDEMVQPSLREGAIFQSPMKLGEYTFDFHEDSAAGGEEADSIDRRERTGKRYTVSIPGTIVGIGQVEYKVYLNMLTKLLEPEFKMLTHEIADKEQFLPTPYLLVTKMFSSAIYERLT